MKFGEHTHNFIESSLIDEII